jgi:hypothetical protein
LDQDGSQIARRRRRNPPERGQPALGVDNFTERFDATGGGMPKFNTFSQ